MIKDIIIDGKKIGRNYPCFIIAEAGVNHNGDMKLAYQLIDYAKASGADAVKFQLFISEELVTTMAPKTKYQTKTTLGSESQLEMLKKLELNVNQHNELKKYCEKIGITYLCTPYEEKSAAALHDLKVAAFKVASTDTNNIPFLKYLAKFETPIFFSTGMSTLGEIETSVNVMKENGALNNIILLHCVSEYPSPMSESNLRAINTLQTAFHCPTGFSDHTKGIKASAWAVALGACVIEKHFTISRSLDGPDHSSSLEPGEFKKMANDIRELEMALGDGIKRPMESESENKKYMQKSLVAKRKILSGEIIMEHNITCKRPGTGLPPLWLYKVIGKKALVDIEENERITLKNVDWND